jgi:colanic acid biosynthesis glycosyl transferase WcaI
VLHAGNIGFGQDLDMVLNAAERLRSRADVGFLFVGDGNRRAELEAAAQARQLANVRFVPYQPRDAVASVYASADTALVSLKHGLAGCIVPSKLYTILAAGRPVVAAVEEASETAAIVREQACGRVVPPGDDDALARAIVQLAADRQACQRLGARAREASFRFSRRGQVSAYATVLREVVDAG